MSLSSFLGGWREQVFLFNTFFSVFFFKVKFDANLKWRSEIFIYFLFIKNLPKLLLSWLLQQKKNLYLHQHTIILHDVAVSVDKPRADSKNLCSTLKLLNFVKNKFFLSFEESSLKFRSSVKT